MDNVAELYDSQMLGCNCWVNLIYTQ